MSNTIDCSRTSHAVCHEPEPDSPRAPAKQPEAPPARTEPGGVSYDCMNECASSLGVTNLVSGAVTSLGCLALPPACPVFVGAAAGATLGACHAACEELEREAGALQEP